jgi:hypothetical protein
MPLPPSPATERPAAGRPIVALRGVGKTFERSTVALEALDLEVREREFVSLLGLEREKFLGHARANNLQSKILRAGVASSVSVESRARFNRAGLEPATENVGVLRHDAQGLSARYRNGRLTSIR